MMSHDLPTKPNVVPSRYFGPSFGCCWFVLVVRTILAILVVCPTLRVTATTCLTNSDCWKGSYCQRDGFCSNPYAAGCLYESLPDWKHKRVCNSEDPATDDGLCEAPEFAHYQELRLFADNWDSAIFGVWILQVLLSELLGVPCTVEAGAADAQVSFYDPHSRFDYGPSNELESLTNGNEYGDCRLTNQQRDDDDYGESDASSSASNNNNNNYIPCANAMLESWTTETFWKHQDEPFVEPAQTNGLLGQEAWFVPAFTAREYPWVTSHYGLSDFHTGSHERRHQLASLFQRPTTWKDYCDEVSPNGCATADATALRAPRRQDEQDRYFVEGLYTGHFRATDENNCTTFPDTCTGHIVDYPCGWTSSVEAQAYHLDMALRSSGPVPHARGYSYGQMQDLWRAANATRSHILMYYWYPEPLYHEFEGTAAAFTRVALPPPTQQCYDHKVTSEQRCDPDQVTRVGSPLGVCDDLPDLLDKIIVASLYDRVYDPAIPDAARSPGYDAIGAYSLDNLQLGELFRKNFEHEHPRSAVCEWMVENLDYMQSMVPPTYPRTLRREPPLSHPGTAAGMAVGSLTALLVVVTAVAVHGATTAIPAVQVEFLRMVLLGAFLLSIGATLKGAPPRPGGCVAAIWLVTIGYTLQLVPVIVKVMAIHRMIAAVRQMRRVNLQRRQLYSAVASVIVLVAGVLLVWSVVDRPQVAEEYVLTDDLDGDGATIVEVTEYCASEHLWEYGVVGWDTILLLCSSVIAYQTRNLDPALNESRTLAFMIYSHFVFVLLRLVVLGLKGTMQGSSLSKLESLVLSLDTISGILIYFFPLLWASKKGGGCAGVPRPTFPTTDNGPNNSSIGPPSSDLNKIDPHTATSRTRSVASHSADNNENHRKNHNKNKNNDYKKMATGDKRRDHHHQQLFHQVVITVPSSRPSREPPSIEALRKKVLDNRQSYYSSRDDCSSCSSSDDEDGAIAANNGPPETAPMYNKPKVHGFGNLMDEMALSDGEEDGSDRMHGQP